MRTFFYFLIFTALVSSPLAGSANVRAKIKKSDIAEILSKDTNTNTLFVRTFSGQMFRLKLSPAQIESIETSLNEKNKTIQAPAAAVSTAKVSEVTEEAKKSPWGMSFLNWTSSNVEKFHNGEGETNFYWRFTVQYKTDSNFIFKFRPTFSIDYDHQTTATTHNLADWVLETQKTGLELFGFSVSPYFRYYVPTGAASRKADSAGMLHLSGKLNREINPTISVYYWPTVRYYLNSKASNVTFDEFDRVSNVPTGNTSLRLMHSIGISEKLNDTFSLGQALALDHRFRYNDPEVGLDENNNTTELEWEASVDMSFVDWLSLTFAVSNKDELGGDDGFSLVSAEKMTYHLVANIVFM